MNVQYTNAKRYRGTSPAAISHHYDKRIDFYKLWIGDSLLYSAGIYVDPISKKDVVSSDEEAQQRKVDLHLNAIGAGPGFRLLDIGCGWGETLKRAQTEYGIDSAVGLTLSEVQRDYVNELAIPRTSIRLESYEDFKPEKKFDGIVNIEAFEHFAKLGLTVEQKHTVYREYFSRCKEFLKPAGRLSMQFCVWGDIERDKTLNVFPQEIFPECDLPYVDEVLETSRHAFDVDYLELGASDYIKTLQSWRKRLNSRMNMIVALSDIDTFKMYDHFLRNAIVGFKRNRLKLCRIVLRAKK